MENMEDVGNVCDWCKKDNQGRLFWTKIKSKFGDYCEPCLAGYEEYIDHKIQQRKDEKYD